MGKIRLAIALMGALGAAVLALPAAAQDAAPTPATYTPQGAQTCLSCHKEPEVLALLRSPHAVKGDARTPFAQHDCESCHGLCSHVLEHVPDDERALAELRRVLRPGGLLVLCVPCVPFYEEPRVTVAHEPGSLLRSLHGHYRTYGLDFVERVSRHFAVENKSAELRPAPEVLRHGLLMWSVVSDLLLVCRA